MVTLEQQTAIVDLQARLKATLEAVPRGAVHPQHVILLLADLAAFVLVQAAEPAHVDDIAEDFAQDFKRRVDHRRREAMQNAQDNLFDWPAAGGQLQ